MSFSEFAQRHGVDRSTVSRWVKAGVISTTAGRIDPESADAELDRNRPIPRGRAAWGNAAAQDSAAGDGWVSTPKVLAGLRAHAPQLLAARLALEELPPATIATASAHLSELLASFVAAAAGAEAEPLEDGTMPPAGVPQLAGVDYAAVVARIAGPDHAAADVAYGEVAIAVAAFAAARN